MGQTQSSRALKETPSKKSSSVRGRKSQTTTSPKYTSEDHEHTYSTHVLDDVIVTVEQVFADDDNDDASTATSNADDDSSCVLSDEEEEDEDWNERLRILEDAKQLKKLAVDYLHPENPVDSNEAMARCYFDRPSAPHRLSVEDADEQAAMMADLVALKNLAVDYMHPELPVVTNDSTVFGRNYYSRASAPEQESPEEAEERVRVLEDAKQLKKFAVDYMHPELPVVTTDVTACGRNYFTRPSAPEYESVEEAEERACILEEAKQLKKLAVDYMHPELPVVATDTTACGRNYFTRASASGHAHMIHTFPPHDHDDHDHSEHMDHFGMDEDLEMELFAQEMRSALPASGMQAPPPPAKGSDEEESNLSRSPSSVMLYVGESIYD